MKRMTVMFEGIKKEREALRTALIHYREKVPCTKSSIARETGLSYQHVHRFFTKDNYPMGILGLQRIKHFLINKGYYSE